MAGFPAANLLADVGGSPVPPAVLSTAFGVGSPTCELVPGTELRQAGSHTGLLRDAGDPARTVFLKKVTASLVASKAWNDRRRVLLYIRNELRFYNEFADGLRRNGVGIPLVQHAAGENLDGIEDYEEEPPAARLERCGALLFMEPFAEASRYVQQSPLSLSQARRLLAAAARLHAAAWEETEVLGRAAERLQRHGGSFALSARNPKELRELTASWSRFMSAFESGAPAGFFARPEIAALGSRLQAAAPWTSAQLSPAPGDRFATLVHGDLKAMNVFLPAAPAEVDSLPSFATAAEGVVLIDFASTGVGFGMADVALHLVHALMPADLEGVGEEALVNSYTLTRSPLPAARPHRPTLESRPCDTSAWPRATTAASSWAGSGAPPPPSASRPRHTAPTSSLRIATSRRPYASSSASTHASPSSRRRWGRRSCRKCEQCPRRVTARPSSRRSPPQIISRSARSRIVSCVPQNRLRPASDIVHREFSEGCPSRSRFRRTAATIGSGDDRQRRRAAAATSGSDTTGAPSGTAGQHTRIIGPRHAPRTHRSGC